MKKIFFLVHSMNVGGVEKALLGLLSILPLSEWEVHVGLIHKKGGFMSMLPKEVKVHEIDCYAKHWRLINDPPLLNIKQMIKSGNLVDAFVHTLLFIQFKITRNRYWFYKFILRKESMFPEEYDLAISFAGPSQMMDYYICEKVKAKKKCGWIHFDVSKFGIDKGMTAQLYKKYDKIFIVSETGKEIFDQMFPRLANKTEVFHNVVSPEQVLGMAETGPTFDDSFIGKRILTVGRISEEKGQRVAINALKILIDKGHRVKWYFVGDGKDLPYCRSLSEKLGISDHVIFLGTQTNPYGYMKDSDIYMQPSRHEGFCITLAEALCFGHPIIATDFTGAREQLLHRDNSIVTGMTAEEMVEGLEGILINNCQECQAQNTRSYDLHPLYVLLSD